jgi:hypothetical protein
LSGGLTTGGWSLDFAEVELVGVDVVRFLNASQKEGVVIANGSLYIREWMLRKRDAPSEAI